MAFSVVVIFERRLSIVDSTTPRDIMRGLFSPDFATSFFEKSGLSQCSRG